MHGVDFWIWNPWKHQGFYARFNARFNTSRWFKLHEKVGDQRKQEIKQLHILGLNLQYARLEELLFFFLSSGFCSIFIWLYLPLCSWFFGYLRSISKEHLWHFGHFWGGWVIYGSIIESLFETPAGSKACVSGANLGAEKPSTEISWKTNGQGDHSSCCLT